MIRPGDRLEHTRAITEEDIRRFTEVSGDRGAHHVKPDAQGRLLAQGLLTATLPTKLGGDLNFLARTMTFEFLKPVYSGDTLTCRGLVESVEPDGAKTRASFSFDVVNQNGVVVMRGSTAGLLL